MVSQLKPPPPSPREGLCWELRIKNPALSLVRDAQSLPPTPATTVFNIVENWLMHYLLWH